MAGRMSRAAALASTLAAVLATVAAAGCGGESADLFAVDRTGDVPGAKLRVVVNDAGPVRCNDGEERRLPGDLLLDAREIARDLVEPAEDALRLEPRPQSVLRYEVHTPEGRIVFADNSAGRPPVLDQLAFLVRRIAREVCGLER